MSDILDLDAIAPKAKQVKINGKVYDVFPARFNEFIEIQQLSALFTGSATTEENMKKLPKIKEMLKGLVPQIDEMNPSWDQLGALFEFIYSKETAGLPQSTEKKIEVTPASPPQSPTS
jgi:hypothetical protein